MRNRINDRAREGMTRRVKGAQYNVHQEKFEFMQVKVVLVIASAPGQREKREEESDEFLSGVKKSSKPYGVKGKNGRKSWQGVRKAA